MSGSALQDLLREFETTGIVRRFAPASNAEIRRAERDLAVEFPDVYREFLLTCGVLLIGTFPQPRPIRAPLYTIPGARKLDKAGLGWPDAPIHDRFVFGLGPFTSTRAHLTESVVFQTRAGRTSVRTKMPPHLVAIWDDWHYEFHCLDLSRAKRGECPIVAYGRRSLQHDAPKPEHVAATFSDWLRDRVRAQVRMKARVERVLPEAKRRS